MKPKNWKKWVALAMSAFMLAPTGVYAEDATANVATTAATIDYNQKGSISLYKYLDNDGQTVDAEGIPYASTPEAMLQAIKDKVGNDSIMPEKGVQFKLLKVADIDQVTENTKNGLNVTGTYYTNFDEGFFNLMNSYLGTNDKLVASDSTKVTDGRTKDATSNKDDHYESDELNEKMMKVIRSTATADGKTALTGESAINRYIRQSNGKAFDVTNEYGYTKLDNLDLGLYLVAEIDFEHSALSKYDTYWEVVNDGNADHLGGQIGTTEDAGATSDNSAGGKPAGGSDYADIASPSSPFLISVPMTNITEVDGHEAGTVWQYDITAYPKNGSINIHKDIVTDDFQGTNQYSANDGQDTRNTETLCDFKQTNYDVDKDGNESTSLDTPSYLTHQIDKNIGDIVKQVVSVDVPRLTDDIDNEQTGANRDTVERKHNAKFVITDRMTKGLQLIDHSSFKVTLTTGAWNDYGKNTTVLVENTDYTLKFGDDAKSYVLTLTAEGLHKLDDIPSASYLYVLYDCEVTKDALIGTDTYGTQRIVVKEPVTDGVSGNQGTTESQLEAGQISDTFKIDDSKTDTHYDSTYKTGENDEKTTTVQHPEATNQNTAELTYATSRTQEHDYYSNTTKVFTYELDLTKTFTDGTKGHVSKTDKDGTHGNNKSFDYSKVKFTIRGEVGQNSKGSIDAQNNATTGIVNGKEVSQTVTGGDKDYEQLLFIRTGDGTYRVWDKYTDGGNYRADLDQYAGLDEYNANADTIDRTVDDVLVNDTITKYVTPNSKTGLLTIRGLDDRIYEITEAATAPGRNLMAEKVYVELKAPSTNKSGDNGQNYEVKLENGSVQHAYVWTGNRKNGNYDIGNYAAALARMNEGRVPLSIQNNEVIKVLKTGGTGNYLFLAVGATALVIGGFFFIKHKKDEEEDSNVNQTPLA